MKSFISIFDVKPTCKIVLTENCWIWNFPAIPFLYISIKNLTKVSKLLKILRYWGLKKTGTSYDQTFGFTDNQWQNILPKVRKSSKIGQGKKTLISLKFLIFWLKCLLCSHHYPILYLVRQNLRKMNCVMENAPLIFKHYLLLLIIRETSSFLAKFFLQRIELANDGWGNQWLEC